MKIVSYIINCFFGKTSSYAVKRHGEKPDIYQVIYQGLPIYEGSYSSCQDYISK